MYFTGLKAAFDEKTLFPKYILDFEAKMKQYHQTNLKEQQVVDYRRSYFQVLSTSNASWAWTLQACSCSL